MDSQLFLVTFDLPNFKWTVLGPNPGDGPDWEIDKLSEKVPELGSNPSNPRIWGVKPGSNNESFYEKMKKDDYLLFYRDGKYRWAGVVGDKFDNEQFDDEYWVEGTECTMLYTVEDLKEIDLSREKLNNTLEYEDRGDRPWNPQGVQRVEPSKVEHIEDEFGSLEEFVDGLVEKAKQDPWWK